MLKELDKINFDQELQTGVKLVEFYTTWCGYCKKQKLELEAMDKVWIGLIDADKEAAIAAKYNVSGFPTFLIFKNGKEVERFSGLKQKEDIMSRIMQHV